MMLLSSQYEVEPFPPRPGHQQAESSVFFTTSCTQSSAPEDGRNYRPEHVELTEIINKIIVVASSWLFILLYQWCMVTQTSNLLDV